MEEVSIMKYQWVKGDKIGNVETIKSEDGEWTLFESGGRINTGLIGEYMIPYDGIEDPEPVNSMASVSIPQQPQHKVKADSRSPIRVLIDKQKDYTEFDLNINLPVKLINKPMYKILATSFGEEEATDELVAFVEHQIQTDSVIELLKESIISLIKERYQAD